MKISKEDLEKLILVDKLSYIEIGKQYNCSATNVKKIAIKLKIILEPRRQINSKETFNKGKNQKLCLRCSLVVKSKNSTQKFCSIDCSSKYRREKYYSDYLKNQESFNYVKDLKHLKPHILKEQNNKCSICKEVNIWQNKELILILDHIDGNAANNLRNNLRCICPNCDSQLDTYKSKNKNSARKERYLLNKK